MGNTTVADGSAVTYTRCALDDSVAGELDANFASTDNADVSQASIHDVAPVTSTGSTVTMDCVSSDANDEAFNTHLVAIKVGSVTGAARHFNTKSPSAKLGS